MPVHGQGVRLLHATAGVPGVLRCVRGCFEVELNSVADPDAFAIHRKARKPGVLAGRRVDWAAERKVCVATAEADFDAEPSKELAAQRRARYLAHVRAQGKLLRTGAEILASPPDSGDPPSDEELLAFLDVIYDARRVDA